MSQTRRQRVLAIPVPQHPQHTDDQLGPERAAIANHPYTLLHKDDPAGPGLWMLKRHYVEEDLIKAATAAIKDPATPPDLRAMVMSFIWPQMVPRQEAQAMYGDASDYADLTFRNSVRELLNTLGWEPEELTARVMVEGGIEELDQAFIDKVEGELARITSQEGEDDDDDDEEEEDTEDEAGSDPLLRVLRTALARLKAEDEAGTLSAEKRAAIFTIFGELFLRPGVAGTESTAQQLHAYMTFRAEREGQVHELTTDYYQAALDKGIKGFFGVAVGPDGLEYDARQPQVFTEWKRAQKKEEEL